MKRNNFIALLLVVALLLGQAPGTVKAESSLPNRDSLINDASPSALTPIELKERTTTVDWSEDGLQVASSYLLFNPTGKKVRLAMVLPFPQAQAEPAVYTPLIQTGQAELRAQYSNGSYGWNLTLEAGQETALIVRYNLPGKIDSQGLSIAAFKPAAEEKWAAVPDQSAFKLNLLEIHPGQIKDIKPLSYQFKGSALSWIWNPIQAKPIIVKADIAGEKKSWESLIPHNDRMQLKALTAAKDYLGTADLLRSKARSADRETAMQLQVAQGYFLEKAGQYNDAMRIWDDLYGDKSRSPRVYWALNQNRQRNAQDLYQRVKDLQINPLLQSWLAADLPNTKVKPTAPEIPKVEADTDSSLQGLILKVTASDKDGDLQKAVFRYYWEGQSAMEKTFELNPFSYEHSVSLFLPAPGSLKRLFYEITLLDKAGHKVTSSEREGFYLNDRIKSQSYLLEGAMLVLADDYTQSEQDKVYKWFLSYVKMAREAEFVPVVERSPYFIFLGENHEFISQYQGPLFIKHTPAPFNPDLTRLSVHRYFLSYWYGPGWSTLPETELAGLGDALMLGKGRYVIVLKYLANEDPQKFADLLGTIGQGQNLRQSLAAVYKIGFWEAQLGAVWYAYGNMVIAVLLIIGFAWLGKTGHITRLLTYFREKR